MDPHKRSSDVRPFRWVELVAESSAPPEAAAAPAEPEVAPGPDPEALLAAAREECEALLAAARAEAERGLAAAREEGFREGLAEGRALAEESAARWAALAEDLAEHKARLFEDARLQVVDLALALTQKILGPLAERDEQAVVRVATHALQVLVDREVVTVRVNPDDLKGLVEAKPKLLQSLDGVKKLTILADPSVARGGCLVETPTAEIDARLESQFQELARSLRKP